jgi:hypothetical protein
MGAMEDDRMPFVQADGPGARHALPMALSREELHAGLRITWHYRGGETSATIVGEPHLVAPPDHLLPYLGGKDWKVNVAVDLASGEVRQQSWYLTDMGVVPRHGQDGWFWSGNFTTLAAD